MKKVYISVICLMSILLVGCFHRKEERPDTPVVVDQDITDTVVDAPSREDVDDVDNDVDAEDNDEHRNEFDENGEFDPAKFEDEDIDEIMDIMKELVEE